MQHDPASTPIRSASSCAEQTSWREFVDLYKALRVIEGRIDTQVRGDCADIYEPSVEMIRRALGRPLDGCSALEIGPGQWMAQARYFSQWMQVTGIDLDVLPEGLSIGAYVRMWRDNGWRRVAKTIGRKLLGFDRMHRRAYERVMPPAKHTPVLRTMDATRMTFDPGTFDVAYSFNVMEHVPDPEAVFRECIRVVKSGGVVFHDFHLYTSDSGAHDTRAVTGERDGLSHWAHLRPDRVGEVRYGGYLNRLSLAEWMAMVDRSFPGAEIRMRRNEHLRGELATLRAAGELAAYSDDQLLVQNIMVAWRKP